MLNDLYIPLCLCLIQPRIYAYRDMILAYRKLVPKQMIGHKNDNKNIFFVIRRKHGQTSFYLFSVSYSRDMKWARENIKKGINCLDITPCKTSTRISDCIFGPERGIKKGAIEAARIPVFLLMTGVILRDSVCCLFYKKENKKHSARVTWRVNIRFSVRLHSKRIEGPLRYFSRVNRKLSAPGKPNISPQFEMNTAS